LESGHKKGGNFFCWVCDAKATRGTELSHILFQNVLNLNDKCSRLKATTEGRKIVNSCQLHYVPSLDKTGLISDLHQREVVFRMDSKTDNLRKILEEEMAGTQHLPALMFDRPKESVDELGLSKYEVMPVEPLHTIAGHIRNLFDEIPRQLNKDERHILERAIKISFGDKQVKRGADHRKSLVELTVYLQQKINPKFLQIFELLCEIQEILYQRHRSPLIILRLHNITFLHATLLVDLVKSPKFLSSRKFFGQYFHALIAHSPQQYRVLPMPSCDAEDEERIFSSLKSSATLTSNHHPENVLLNAFIRLQVRQELKDEQTKPKRKKSTITKTGQKLPERKPTLFPFKILEKYTNAWQAHLERIGDFLNFEGIWEETKDGVVFKDINFKISKNLHHFRTHSIKVYLYIQYVSK